MKTFNIIFIIMISLICGSLLAQESQKMDKERFNFLMDSLSVEKNRLLKEKETLLVDIDSLRNVITKLDEKWTSGRVSQLRKKYGKKVANRIAMGQVWRGMSDKMLEDSWGKPDKITKNKEKWGVFTQWYYGDITYFFKDGIMTDWEEKK